MNSPISTACVQRRGVATLAWALALALLLPAADLAAQPVVYPQPGRAIRLMVGLAAGGSLDAQARVIAQKLTEQTGVQVIVENKPGASMMLAASEVARAAPDGYTLLFAPSSTFAQNPHTLNSVPYDPFKDFTPITLASRGPLVLTLHSSVPASNVRELVAWARAHPGQLSFASFGVGTSSHLYAEAFAKAAGIDMVHVPYKGTADAARDLLEGRVQAYFDAAPTAIINEKTGKIRIIGVAAPVRNPFIPNVPTISEQGVAGIDLTSWIAVVGPARLPPELVARINAMFVQALSSAPVREAIAKGAYEAVSSTPAELNAEMRSAYERWGAMVRQIGFQKQ
ncbi:Bug family tripartite tricarboxylate transporter substrate binding protein [Aquabacterium sp.]|uniref:Bug family tripartite tricarboxylate transporter substrate binding protein n=1 Tax=Aquabacterium sp. TaxID=1872578 RepID=UPI002CEF8142|nr:tripartite tricarboxylate transporter substrate binding protein [Aquabacterium sp.]HSW05041.1 tripartite tricarboxylate transporter substrate binding protein [Aquabacterium sp.]